MGQQPHEKNKNVEQKMEEKFVLKKKGGGVYGHIFSIRTGVQLIVWVIVNSGP